MLGSLSLQIYLDVYVERANEVETNYMSMTILYIRWDTYKYILYVNMRNRQRSN